MKKTLLLALTGFLILGAAPSVLAKDNVQQPKVSDTTEENKPIVAVVKASWCPACQKIDSTVKDVMKKSMAQADWVVFDISNKKSTDEAKSKAAEMGLQDFFKAYGSRTATVAIIDPKTKKVLKVLMAENNAKKYYEALKQAQKQI